MKKNPINKEEIKVKEPITPIREVRTIKDKQGLNKEINEEFLKRESELREIIKHNYKIGYKFASIGDKYDKEENDILIKKFPDKKISLLVDTTEYNLKEVAEILGISYKHCNRLFVKYNIPFVRREKNGSIFLGKTIKNHFNAEKSNNFLNDCS